MEADYSDGREVRIVMIGAYLPKCISSRGCPTVVLLYIQRRCHEVGLGQGYLYEE